MAARSIVINLRNNVDVNQTHPGKPHHLVQTGASLSHGVWTPNRVPPQRIDAGTQVTFEAESQGFATGVEGSITFQVSGYGSVTLSFDNPFSGSNSGNVTTRTEDDGWVIRASYSDLKGNNATWDVDLAGPPAGKAGLLKHNGTGRYVDNFEGGTSPGTHMILWWQQHHRNTVVLTDNGHLYHCGTGLLLVPENLSVTEGARIVLASPFQAIFGNVPKWEYRSDQGLGIQGQNLTMAVYGGTGSTNGSEMVLWSGSQTPFNGFTFVDYSG